jgi:hypothetical protein
MKQHERIKQLMDIYAQAMMRKTASFHAIVKIAVIRHKSDGYYVESESGRNLGGPYKTRAAAKKRLDEVEMFKHMKKKKRSDVLYHLLSLADDDVSYSSVMRKLRADGDLDKIRAFQKAFKKSFDDAYCQGLEPVEQIALLSAIKTTNNGQDS